MKKARKIEMAMMAIAMWMNMAMAQEMSMKVAEIVIQCREEQNTMEVKMNKGVCEFWDYKGKKEIKEGEEIKLLETTEIKLKEEWSEEWQVPGEVKSMEIRWLEYEKSREIERKGTIIRVWSERGVEFYPKEGKTFYVEKEKTFPVEVVVKYEVGMNKKAKKKWEEMEKKWEAVTQEVERVKKEKKTLEEKIEKQGEEIQGMKKEIEEQKESIERLKEKNQGFVYNIQSHERSINKQKKIMEEQWKTIEEQKKEIEEQKKEIEEHKKKIEEQNKRIGILESETKEQKSVNEDQGKRIGVLENKTERLKKFSKKSSDGRYLVYGRIIYDSKTGLEWREGPDKDTTWNEAIYWAESLGNGWRMPTKEELEKLYEPNKTNEKCKLDPVFQTRGGRWVWYKEQYSSQCSVDFRYGGSNSFFNSIDSSDFRGFAVRAEN
jgi:hypothetical protein